MWLDREDRHGGEAKGVAVRWRTENLGDTPCSIVAGAEVQDDWGREVRPHGLRKPPPDDVDYASRRKGDDKYEGPWIVPVRPGVVLLVCQLNASQLVILSGLHLKCKM